MAKGNLFQGMARGKVGDVVFYRMNGVQMSRVRNRAPKNPRSNEQLYQRCVIASVMKAYSAGKEIFDHAFQGYTVGEGCMRRFNSVNANILRAGLIAQLNTDAEECTFHFVPPRSLYPPTMNGFQISEGTLVNKLFFPVDGGWEMPNAQGGVSTIKQYLQLNGTYAGDIYTFILNTVNKKEIAYKAYWTNSEYATQYATGFGFIRLIIRSDISDEKTLEGATFEDVFEIELGGNVTNFASNQGFEPGSEIQFNNTSDNKIVSIGCIRSRVDQDLRSTAYMIPKDSTAYGIVAPYVLPVWQEEVEKVGESDLILEGGLDPGITSGNWRNLENPEIIPAPVNEAPVRRTARHRGTQNNKK